MRPWKVKGWVIPPESDSDFVAAMERVLDIYKRPYNEKIPVVCMDESPKQLIGETRIGSPMKRGQEKREDYEYVREGTCNIFMVNEPLAVHNKRLTDQTEKIISVNLNLTRH